jgi:glycosyltransferase involved in cell wall biosynthesis
MKPKISLTIPTFNRADLLDQTLQTVMSQTSKPFQVIVIDNASTDETPQVVRKYKKYGVKYHRNKTNLGMVGNYNQCIKLATGTHISFLHSDDLIAPNWHKTWLNTITNNNAGIYHCSICIINKNNQPQIIYHTFNQSRLIPKNQIIPQLIQHHCPVIAPTGATVFNLKTLKSAGPFIEKYATEADIDIFLKIIQQSNLYYQKSILFAHRSHPEQTFETKKSKKSITSRLQKLENYFKIIKQFANENISNRHLKNEYILENIFMSLGSINLYLLLFQFKRVLGANKIAIKVFPWLWSKPRHWIVFTKVQAIYIFRALKMRLAPPTQPVISWLKKIKT